jgi:hypothetical protein
VQPPPLPRQSVPRSGSRLRRDGVQLVGVISRAPSYRGRHMANPETTNAPVGGGAFASVRQQYRIMASCSPIQMDVKPFPLSDPYPLLITATRARMTGCAARCRVARHREARYHRNLHQDEFGPTRTEPGCKRCGNAPSPDPSAIRNSLLFLENSLLAVQKFPAPLRREFWQ